MFKKMILVAVAGVALTGCGSICSRAESVYENLEDKIRPCAAQGFEMEAFNTNQCEDTIDSCSDSEREALENYLDCLEKVSTCQPSNSDPFVTELTACVAKLSNVGATCLSPF